MALVGHEAGMTSLPSQCITEAERGQAEAEESGSLAMAASGCEAGMMSLPSSAMRYMSSGMSGVGGQGM